MLASQNTSVLATPSVLFNVQAHGGLFWNMPSSVTSLKCNHSGCCCVCWMGGARTPAVSEGRVCVHPWRVSYIIFSTKNVPWSACKMPSALWANPMSLWEKAMWFRVVSQKRGAGCIQEWPLPSRILSSVAICWWMLTKPVLVIISWYQYSWLLNSLRARGADSLHCQNSVYNFFPPQINCE